MSIQTLHLTAGAFAAPQSSKPHLPPQQVSFAFGSAATRSRRCERCSEHEGIKQRRGCNDEAGPARYGRLVL